MKTQNMMSEEYLLNVIEKIISSKADRNISPNLALEMDLRVHIWEDVRKCLRKLFDGQQIKYRKTLNSWGVELNE